MRKIFAVVLLQVLMFSLVACGKSVTTDNSSRLTSSSEAVSSSTSSSLASLGDSSSSVASSSNTLASSGSSATSHAIAPTSKVEISTGDSKTPTTGFVNESLLSFPGKFTTEINDAFGSDYFYVDIGSMSAGLEYYNPYICFYIDNNSHGGMGPTSIDPFRADTLIHRIALKSNYDDSSHTIVDQTSMKNLFNTDAQITYDLLSSELGQTPELVYNLKGQYEFIAEKQINKPYITLPGGTYNALYVINGVNVSVTFVESNSSYIALTIDIG